MSTPIQQDLGTDCGYHGVAKITPISHNRSQQPHPYPKLALRRKTMRREFAATTSNREMPPGERWQTMPPYPPMILRTQRHGDSIHSFLGTKDGGGADIICLDNLASLVRPSAYLEAFADALREDPDVLALVRMGCNAPFSFLIVDNCQFLVLHSDCVPSSNVVKRVTRLSYRFPVKFEFAPRIYGMDFDPAFGQSEEDMSLPRRKPSKRRKVLPGISWKTPTTTFPKRSHCSEISIEANNNWQAPVNFKLHWEVHPLGLPDDFLNLPPGSGLFACRLGVLLRAKLVSYSGSGGNAIVSAMHVKHTATVLAPQEPVRLHGYVWRPETAYRLALVDTNDHRRYGPDTVNVRQSYAVFEGTESPSSLLVTEKAGSGGSHGLGVTVLPTSSFASAYRGCQDLVYDAVIGIKNMVGDTLPMAHSTVTLQVDITTMRDGEPVSSCVFLQTLTLTNMFGNGQFTDGIERSYVIRSQSIAPETPKPDPTSSNSSTISTTSATSIIFRELKRQSQQLLQSTFDPVAKQVRPAKMSRTGRIYAWARMARELRSRASVSIKLNSMHRPVLSLDSGEISDAMRERHHWHLDEYFN